jgi:glycosyltransferase involved in cell wall biosynthesis
MALKIHFVYPSAASNVLLKQFVGGVTAAGHEVSVSTDTRNAGLPDLAGFPAGVRVVHTDMPRGLNPRAHWRAARQLRRTVLQIRPDVVQAHMSAAVFTTALARNWHTPTVGSFHGLSFALTTGPWRRAVLRRAEMFAASRMDRAQVVNEADYAALRGCVPEDRLDWLPQGLGCELDRIVPVHRRAAVRRAVRSQLRIADGAPVMTFVGRFTEFKGFDRAVRAFREASLAATEARLLLVGCQDPLHPTGLSLREWHELARDTRLIMVGFSPYVPELLAASDVLLFPSEREGLSTCIGEALASGVPVITTDARGCADLVRSGATGVIVPRHDHRGLVAAIEWLLQDVTARSQMSAEARRVGHLFDRRKCVEDAIHLYETLGGVHGSIVEAARPAA